MKTIETNKHFAILDEIENSYKLIIYGLKELQNMGVYNKYYFLSLQLLSQGIERWLKIYICLSYFDKNEKLPNHREIKKYSHNLELLHKDITELYFKKEDFKNQFLLDFEFLTNNDDLKRLLNILSKFGEKSRYHCMDVITDNPNKDIDVIESWKDFENDIKKKFNYNLTITDEYLENLQEKINTYIIVIIEKYLSAISRQFIHEFHGELPKIMIMNNFYNFGKIYDGEYGAKDYSK
ncbi:hypothetical protein NZ698_16840 [Chryseobacterium sp. PBS4-4]|uniref:HEPN domain-containing protein n=1 Tax=Chryseobacterium edaphi TaxID=2976532 RepID=A0ABT2W9J0_9FLAO|nr:hypothetical protein [Chryseobacterium edaphi]MCU7618849.1 hypothetical protein [Chryseobacterium edaphi]